MGLVEAAEKNFIVVVDFAARDCRERGVSVDTAKIDIDDAYNKLLEARAEQATIDEVGE